jgi:anion-transporting  ArsA/GET3 family ATPase
MGQPARFYLFMGSGGVGKTTLSAAWALAQARRGLRVALITIDPAKRLAQSLGLNDLESKLAPTSISDHLWAMMLDQENTSYRLVERFTSTPDQASKIINNKYFKVFSRVLAGAQEMMAVYEVHEAIYDGRFDVVVLDTPPAQHALDFLEVPNRLSQALDGPALRWLINKDQSTLKSASGWRARLGGLGKNMALRAFTTVTSAPFVEDLLEFINLFGGILIQLRSRGVSLEDLLKSTSAELWIVTSPDQPQLISAQEVTHTLQNRGYPVKGWLINRTPSLICDLLNDVSEDSGIYTQLETRLEDESLRGIAELSELIAQHHAIEHETMNLRDHAILAWRREIERAKIALSNLHLQLGETDQSQHVVELVEEILLDLTPLERIEHLARLLEHKIQRPV